MNDERLSLPSASSLARLVKCPGSEAIIRETCGGWPSEQSEEAKFGSDVHSILSQELSEMSASERAAWVAEKCRRLRVKLISEIFGQDKQLRMFVETRFWLKDRAGNKVFSAKPDLVTGENGVFLCLEYKSLTGYVDPVDENFQILSQCAAFVDDDETRNSAGEVPVTEVLGAIVQPLVRKDPILVRFGVQDLLRAKHLILSKLDEAKTVGAPRIPGLHCTYCPAKAKCPEAASFALALPKEFNLGIEHLTPAMIGQILPRLSAVQKVVDDIKDRAKAIELANPGTFKEAGYEIKEYEGARFIQGQETIQEIRYALAQWITKEQITQMIELPIGQLREAFIEAATKADPKLSKTDAGDLCNEILESRVQRKAGSQRLVKVK